MSLCHTNILDDGKTKEFCGYFSELSFHKTLKTLIVCGEYKKTKKRSTPMYCYGRPICLSLRLWIKRTEWCQSILTKGTLFLVSFIWVMFRVVVVHHTMKETTLKIQVPNFTRSLSNMEHYRLFFFVKCYMVSIIGMAWDVAFSWISRKMFWNIL